MSCSFSTAFLGAFKDGVITQVKEEVNGSEDPEFKLIASPPPSEPLKSGTLTKQGDMVKNWKKRHFVIFNEADNFRVEYSEKEGGKKKGT
jgi:hypothetical protein